VERKDHECHRSIVSAFLETIGCRMILSFRDLVVWKKAIALVVETYRISRAFPHEERFGLTAQIRRAVVSIPSNIAEGHGRHHTADFCRFLSMARGSLKEVESDFVIAEELAYVSTDNLRTARVLSDEISRMLSGLQRKLRARKREKPNSRSQPR
jgi:four helix bundle protein